MCKPKSGVTETEAPQANPIEIASGKSLILIILLLDLILPYNFELSNK